MQIELLQGRRMAAVQKPVHQMEDGREADIRQSSDGGTSGYSREPQAYGQCRTCGNESSDGASDSDVEESGTGAYGTANPDEGPHGADQAGKGHKERKSGVDAII